MRYKVEFEFEVEDDKATDEQIEEWLRYRLNDNGSMTTKNPLGDLEVEPIFGTFYWGEA